MRKQTLVLMLSAVLVCLAVGAAEAGTISVPVKGVIDASGSVDLSFTFYGRAAGGRGLFTANQTLVVTNNTYFGRVEVPDTLFNGREKVYFEVARTSAPAIVLGDRAQFTHREGGAPPQRSVSILGCSLCFTCGGSFPVFSGAFNTSSSPAINERGSSCSGSVTGSIADSRPFICCQ